MYYLVFDNTTYKDTILDASQYGIINKMDSKRFSNARKCDSLGNVITKKIINSVQTIIEITEAKPEIVENTQINIQPYKKAQTKKQKKNEQNII